jgi:hypothetical protein
MGDITNLRQARKRKRRSEREREAAANRALHGRRADEIRQQWLIHERDEARLEAHRRVRSGDNDPE